MSVSDQIKFKSLNIFLGYQDHPCPFRGFLQQHELNKQRCNINEKLCNIATNAVFFFVNRRVVLNQSNLSLGDIIGPVYQ